MKLKSKLIAGMLLAALLPLTLSMGLSLWDNIKNTRQLTIDAAHHELRYIAEHLSSYFLQRISEIKVYARSPVIRSMDYQQFSPFIKQEIEYQQEIFEKFLIARPDGHYYYTAGGNPYLGGVASFDDTSADARAKSIATRDYWLYTVGNNDAQLEKSYVSNPMISYTTGAKQIVVATSIVDTDAGLIGMFGGSLAWPKIEQHIDELRKDLEARLPWDARLFLISPEGIYWYHWEPEKVVHIKTDALGKPVINALGEKVSVRSRIIDEANPELAEVGRQMMKGEDGYALVTDNQTGDIQGIFYSPVSDTGYAVGIQVPYQQINQPVSQLIRTQSVVTLVAILFVLVVAIVLSRKMARPITSLRDAADEVSHGHWDHPLPSGGDDEVSDLTRSFNAMIDSLKQREDSLASSEERFALAMKGSNDGLWDWNMLSGEVYYSPRWKNMLGYNEDDIAHKIASFESLTHPDDLAGVRDQIQAYLEQRVSHYEVELRMRHKDGHYLDVLSRGFVLRRESDGEATRFVGTHTDISERKRTEAALIAARDAAEQANFAKSQFLSNMSHELRTPLNAIIGFAAVLETDKDQHLSDHEKRNLTEITSAGWHLLDLINDILDLAKIEVGKLHVQLTVVKLIEVIEECEAVLAPAASNRDISVSESADCKNYYLSADRLRLKQVMLNLMSNAIKYNKSGGQVRIDCMLVDSKLMKISVTDNGPGIPAASQQEIFEPFNRLDSQNQCIEGAGVGLSISRHLIHLMGGDIGVESREGEGSTFWITIPVANAPVSHQSEEKIDNSAEAIKDDSSKFTILCVEDNPANLDLLKEVLTRVADYQILVATTGKEGLEIAQKHQPDLILMDINMPDMNGIEATQKIRSHKTISRTPIIGLSANALQKDIDNAISKGFDDYVTKPFAIRDLLATIKHWLEDKKP